MWSPPEKQQGRGQPSSLAFQVRDGQAPPDQPTQQKQGRTCIDPASGSSPSTSVQQPNPFAPTSENNSRPTRNEPDLVWFCVTDQTIPRQTRQLNTTGRPHEHQRSTPTSGNRSRPTRGGLNLVWFCVTWEKLSRPKRGTSWITWDSNHSRKHLPTSTWATRYGGQRIGEAKHPGPPGSSPPNPTHLLIECGNITHLQQMGPTMKDRKSHYFFGQEHSLLPRDRAATRAGLRPWQIHMIELDPEATQPTGGIFAMRHDGKPILQPKPCSKHLLSLQGNGRVYLYAIELTPQIIVLVYNIYAWTNGNHNKTAAHRTNDMLAAIFDDIDKQPTGPVLVMGDF